MANKIVNNTANGTYDYAFFCETLSSRPGAQPSSFSQAQNIVDNNLHYTTYQNGVPIVLGNNAALLPDGNTHFENKWRAPLGITIQGNANTADFYFWHSISGDGAKQARHVEAVYNYLAQIYANGVNRNNNQVFNFVLFADLNVQPARLEGNGVIPQADILYLPNRPTRISGKILDYVITNLPGAVGNMKHLVGANVSATFNGQGIKHKCGSDHLPVSFEFD